jgi:F-type H+-transporting ATPase subunit delta
MSQISKAVAHRYAKPLLELANQKGLLDEVNRDMKLLGQTCEENPQLVAILRNPIIRGFKKYSILKGIFEPKVNPMTMAMFEVLARHSREEVLYEISQEFNALYNIFKGIQVVNLTSTVPFTETMKTELVNKLTKELNKTIELKEEIDPSLIGGFVVQIGDKQIDNSVKNSLLRLKQDFNKKIYS